MTEDEELEALLKAEAEKEAGRPPGRGLRRIGGPADGNGRRQPPRRGARSGFFRMGKRFASLALLLIVSAAAAYFVWYECRIEVETGQIAILIRKTGRPLPPDRLLAEDDRQQGVQARVLQEGRYFLNPYSWDWRLAPIVDIPAGQLGVVTRLHGKEPAAGRIAAAEGERGIVAEVLRPGKHPDINPYAEAVEKFDALTIPAGSVGVLTRLDGQDPFDLDLPDGAANALVVPEGVKGVQAHALLDPGTYYLNPYLAGVTAVNLQSQRFELSGADAIAFLTEDGFTITVEGTLEFAVRRSAAAKLTQQVGDLEDILKKLVLPHARGFSRIEGSKQPAVNFIAGETRQQFQDSLEKHLKAQGDRWGIDVRSVLVRNITPPNDVAVLIREREVALQDQRKIEQQIAQAQSKAKLTEQEMLAKQNTEKVEAETAAIRNRIKAEQERAVYLTAAERNLEVARIDLETAALQAETRLITARADQEVVARQNQADADVARARVAAFGGGLDLARYAFYRRIAPRIGAIISTDRAPGLGGLFSPLLPEGPSGAPAVEIERERP